jgi:hypothetical protein
VRAPDLEVWNVVNEMLSVLYVCAAACIAVWHHVIRGLLQRLYLLGGDCWPSRLFIRHLPSPLPNSAGKETIDGFQLKGWLNAREEYCDAIANPESRTRYCDYVFVQYLEAFSSSKPRGRKFLHARPGKHPSHLVKRAELNHLKRNRHVLGNSLLSLKVGY